MYAGSIPAVASIFLEDFSMNVPEGFEPFPRKSPVTEPWEPIYCKRTPEAVILAVRLAKAHTEGYGWLRP